MELSADICHELRQFDKAVIGYIRLHISQINQSGDYSKIFARIIFEWITHPIGLLRIATDLALGIGIRIDVSFEEPHDMTHFKEE
jgi:hypothetical protein